MHLHVQALPDEFNIINSNKQTIVRPTKMGILDLKPRGGVGCISYT